MLIVDTNQVALLPRPRRHLQRRLVLPEVILAEILLRGQEGRAKTFRVIGRYNIRIGMQPSDVLDEISGLSEAEIRRYRPFRTTATDYGRSVVRMVRRNRPPDGLLRAAPQIKQRHLDFMRRLHGAAMGARREIRTRPEIGRADTFAEVAASSNHPDSFVGSLVVSATRHGARVLKVSDEAFLAAAMGNPYLSHYFLGILHYVTSISKVWRPQKWNVDPRPDHDDWSDITLLLYLNDERDVLVTEDKLVRRMVHDVAPTVRVRLAKEL